MFVLVFILFISVPIIEIAVLIKVGGLLGFWITIFIVVLTAILGTYMLRSQSITTLQAVQSRLNSGSLPATQLIEGVILLVGGVLLLTPGFITDAFGFFCLVPVCRQWLVNRMLIKAKNKIFSDMPSPSTSSENSVFDQNRKHTTSDVIEGEFHRRDENK